MFTIFDIENENDRKSVVNFILEGKKVNAIKATRQSTGLGLKESKTIVDNFIREEESKVVRFYNFNEDTWDIINDFVQRRQMVEAMDIILEVSNLSVYSAKAIYDDWKVGEDHEYQDCTVRMVAEKREPHKDLNWWERILEFLS